MDYLFGSHIRITSNLTTSPTTTPIVSSSSSSPSTIPISPSTIRSTIVSTKFKVEDIIIDANSLSNNYECQICFESIIDLNKPEVLQCKEGHMYCRNCWVTSLSTRRSCMQCRTPINSIYELSRNRYIEKEFSEKLVRCPNSAKEIYKSNIGPERSLTFDALSPEQQQLLLCNQQSMKIELLNSHLKNCEFQLLSCDLCEKKFKKSETNKHQDECIYVKVTCSYCSKSDISRFRLDEHYSRVCPNYTIECDSCKSKIKRTESTTHKQNDCPNTIVECKYTSCGKILERSKMIFHSTEHLSTLFTIIGQQSLRIEQQSTQLHDINKKYDELSNNFIKLEIELAIISSSPKPAPIAQDTNKKYDELLNKFNKLEIEFKNVKSKQITPPPPPKPTTPKSKPQTIAPIKPITHKLTTSVISKKPTTTTTTTSFPSILTQLSQKQNKSPIYGRRLSENRFFGSISIESYTIKSLSYPHKSHFRTDSFIINGLKYRIAIYPNGIAGSQAKLSIILVPPKEDESNFNFRVNLKSETNLVIDTISGVFIKGKDKIYGFPRFFSSKDITDSLEFDFELTVGVVFSKMTLYNDYYL